MEILIARAHKETFDLADLRGTELTRAQIELMRALHFHYYRKSFTMTEPWQDSLPPSAWYAEGRNHRVENYQDVRDIDDVWWVADLDIEQVVELLDALSGAQRPMLALHRVHGMLWLCVSELTRSMFG